MTEILFYRGYEIPNASLNSYERNANVFTERSNINALYYIVDARTSKERVKGLFVKALVCIE